MDHAAYEELAKKVGWREAFRQWDQDRRVCAARHGVLMVRARDLMQKAWLQLEHDADMAHEALVAALAEDIARADLSTDAAYWEQRYKDSLARCRQLLKRATDAERVVDAARHLHGDILCNDCGSAYCGGSCVVGAALADYDAGKHR